MARSRDPRWADEWWDVSRAAVTRPRPATRKDAGLKRGREPAAKTTRRGGVSAGGSRRGSGRPVRRPARRPVRRHRVPRFAWVLGGLFLAGLAGTSPTQLGHLVGAAPTVAVVTLVFVWFVAVMTLISPPTMRRVPAPPVPPPAPPQPARPAALTDLDAASTLDAARADLSDPSWWHKEGCRATALLLLGQGVDGSRFTPPPALTAPPPGLSPMLDATTFVEQYYRPELLSPPPKPKRRRSRCRTIADKCRAHPGQWVQLDPFVSSAAARGFARDVARGRRAAFRDGIWETAQTDTLVSIRFVRDSGPEPADLRADADAKAAKGLALMMAAGLDITGTKIGDGAIESEVVDLDALTARPTTTVLCPYCAAPATLATADAPPGWATPASDATFCPPPGHEVTFDGDIVCPRGGRWRRNGAVPEKPGGDA